MIIKHIWELIINLLEAFAFFFLFSKKLTTKEQDFVLIKQTLYIIACAVLLTIFNSLSFPALLNMTIFLFLHLMYGVLFFKDSLMKSFFWTVVYSAITISADAITTMFPTMLLKVELSTILAKGSMRIPFTLLYILILYGFVLIIIFFTTNTFKLKLIEKLLFSTISFLCITIEEIIVMLQLKMEANLSTTNYILNGIFFLVMTLFLIFVFLIYSIGNEHEKIEQLTILQTQSELEKKQQDEIIDSVTELRFIKHDIQNNLNILYSMMENKKYDECTEYLSNLCKSVESSYFVVSTGNIFVDSIVTLKLLQCKNANIPVSHTIHLSNNISIPDVELCTIIGNLFDNAIEATTIAINESKKGTAFEIHNNMNDSYIDFQIKPFNNMISLKITNITNGKYLFDKNGELISTKKDHVLHGLGLNRIKAILDKYGGFITITPDDTLFSASILIPNNNNT